MGDRYLIGFRLLSFPATNSSGETWDPQLPFPLPIDGIGPEPDIAIAYKRDIDANFNSTSPAYDIKTSSLPYEWKLRTGIKIEDTGWELVMNDDEGIFGTEKMLGWTGTLHDIGSDGVITITLNKAVLEVLYEIR